MKTLADYTKELEERVLDITLLGQLPYDEADLAALRAGLRPLFAGGTAEGLRRIDRRHDLAFAVYLVLEGTYHYDAGNFWSSPLASLSLTGSFRQQVGNRFRRTMSEWGLPTFEHLRGHVYVAPILAHAGIPSYCLDDFFDLLDRALRREAAPDAATLIEAWGEADFPPTIGQPVQRFLRFGGPVAEDFVGRCLELWQAGDPAELDLPDRVIERYEMWRAARGERAAPGGLRLTRPVLRLDPYGEGPALILSPVVFAAGRAPGRLVWRIEAGERRREETAVRRRTAEGYAYAPRAAVNVLTAAPRYVVTLLADDHPLQTWAPAGPGEPPLLAFDPDTGDALPLGRDGGNLTISPGERWLAFPRGWMADESGEARRLAVLPDQTGDWASFAFETWRLGPDERLTFATPGGPVSLRAQHDPAPTRPRLVGPRVAGDGGGAPALFSEPPALLFPRGGRAERPSAWRCTLEALGPALPSGKRRESLDALAHRLEETAEGLRLSLAAPELLGAEPFGAFRLRARGPYGRSAEFEFSVVPGLRLSDYPRLYRGETEGPATFTVVCAPGIVAAAVPEAEGVAVGPAFGAASPPPHGDARRVTVAPQLTAAPLSFRHPSGALVEADIPIYRLRWGLYEPNAPDRFDWSGRPLSLYPDALESRHAAEVRVDRPFWGEGAPPVGWRLIEAGGRELRRPPPKDRPSGRYVATRLAEWLDACREARGVACLQLLLPGEGGESVGVDVAYLRPSLDMGRVDADWRMDDTSETLTLLWERNEPLRSRQLRLWPLDRPWVAQPIVLPIPDTADGCHEWRLPEGLLPAGEYLGEFVVADPWGGVSARPEPDAPGVIGLLPSDFGRVVARRLAGKGRMAIDELLGLLLCAARRPELREALADVGNALWRRRAELPPDLLLLWANVARDSGNALAYQLAQRALFAPERVAALSADGELGASALPYIDHLPPRLPQREVYVALLPAADGERRRLCIEELCRDGHAAGYEALLEDVARGRISLADAAAWLEQDAGRAVDFLLAADGLWSAPAVLRALLERRPTIQIIHHGSDVSTNVGYARVRDIRHRQTGKQVAACRRDAGPYEVRADLNPYTAPNPIAIDLEARRIRFLRPVYKCHHNGGACDRVFNSADELSRHCTKDHRIFPYRIEQTADVSVPLKRLIILPPDGV